MPIAAASPPHRRAPVHPSLHRPHSGPLPDFWNGLVVLTLVNIEANQFTGTVPPDWGRQGYYVNNTYNDTQAIQYLWVNDNRLTGGVPAGWAANGSFPVLRVASLAGNPLGGTLPPEWGDDPTALPALTTLSLEGCSLTGTLPPEWGPGLESLQEL